eukprot:m.186619 g.186619  ORF g.186619 m.186619 type:complete len:982 (+) comp16923_c0_seq2:141-3086(+)
MAEPGEAMNGHQDDVDPANAQPYPGFESGDDAGLSSSQASMIRMIQNEFFQMPMALHYLLKTPELTKVLCSRMSQYSGPELEFYLPQLLCIYLSQPPAYGDLKEFLLELAARNIHFAFLALMLLRAELGTITSSKAKHDATQELLDDIRRCKVRRKSSDALSRYSGTSRDLSPSIPEAVEEPVTPTRPGQATKLMLGSDSPPLSDRPPRERTPTPTNDDGEVPPSQATTPSRPRGHRRSKSDVVHSPMMRGHVRTESAPIVPDSSSLSLSSAYSQSSGRLSDWLSKGFQNSLPGSPLGSKNWLHSSRNSLDSGKLFDEHSLSSRSGLDQLEVAGVLGAQHAFIDTLVDIGDNLMMLRSKAQRRVQLQALLGKLNLNLPARVYMPLCGHGLGQLSSTNHFVVHIPPQEAVVLNSKDKVPYMIQVEVVQCEDFLESDLPPKFGLGRPKVIRHVRSFSEGQARTTDDSHVLAESLDRIPPPSPDSSSSSASTQSLEGSSQSRLDTLRPASLASDEQPTPHDSDDITPTKAAATAANSETSQGTGDTDTPQTAPITMTSPSTGHSDAGRSRFFSWSFFGSKRSPRKAPEMAVVAEVASPLSEQPRDAPDLLAASVETVQGLEKQASFEDDRPSDVLLEQEPDAADDSEIPSAVEPTIATPDSSSTPALKTMDIRRRLSQAANTPENQFQHASVDPSALKSKENFAAKVKRIRRMSPYGHLRSWHLISAIVKTGDDLRQELLATQLLKLFQKVFKDERLALWLRPLQILVTSNNSGLIEVVGSAVSLHQTKRSSGDTLLAYFEQEFGPQTCERFMDAQQNFVESLAAYSLFTHFAQVKDRHNGNIMIDSEGHILHIDYGFFFSNSPGRNMGFENAPFKLLQDFVAVMGGPDSDMFKYYRMLIFKGFLAARKHREAFVTLLRIAQADSKLPCFVGGEAAFAAFEKRFQRGLTDEVLMTHVDTLIDKSLNNTRTKLYDNFQYYTNGIL